MFKLKRYFSITSLIGIVVVILILSTFFRYLALQTLMEHQTIANINLTHSFANSVWNHFNDFVVKSSLLPTEELKLQRKLEHLQLITRQQMHNTNVVKVKIYNLNGLTVFSTDHKQIGKDKSQNQGFLQAKSGIVASEITFRNEFYSFDGVISDRNLISSYIPIRDPSNSISAIFEVYSDVTPLVERIKVTQYIVIMGVLSTLGILYLFLFLIIRRADRILNSQELERKENENKIRYQVYHDSLTGLPNRDAFSKYIGKAVKRAIRHNKDSALMFLDLDRFKLINDSLGHDAGDQLLIITAKRIKKCLRETDCVFRLSGDEFVVIVDDMDEGKNASSAAHRILETMAEPISLNDHAVIVNISIGITTFPKPDMDVSDLLKEADTAMYRAKGSGHNNYEFYVQEINTISHERLLLETDLHLALKNDQFILHYQTKVDSHSTQVTSVEALIRWNHPEKGRIPPDKFISLLEEIGLINAVGNWVLITACQQLQQWIKDGLAPIRMSVNISAKQFRNPKLVETVRNTIRVTGIDPQYLELELTESMLVEDTEHAIQIMHQLKKLGLSLSIDDFGSGYSSLSYLKHFPVDYLKIDRSFIKDLSTNNKDAAITTAIIALAHSLNLGLIGEGIENEKQREFLKDRGCNELQGFLFSQPVSADKIKEVLLNNKEK